MNKFIYIVVTLALILALLCNYHTNAPADKPKTTPIVDLAIMPTPIPTAERKPTQARVINRKMTVTAYGYCSCVKCCGKSNAITATGTKAREGRTIAVDTNLIKLGSEVIINGHTYVAEDTGGGIKGNKIDIFFGSHAAALNFGVRKVVIEVVK